MWNIKTDSGHYAVKELNPSIIRKEGVKEEYELTEEIARDFILHGIPAVAAILYNHHSLVEIEDSTYIIYPWVDAKPLGQDEVSLWHAEKIGAIIASMHKLNLKAPGLKQPEWDVHPDEAWHSIINRVVKIQLPFSEKLNQLLNDLLQWNDRFKIGIANLNKTLVVSHGDLDQKNVLWTREGKPVLIDWESARLLNPTMEIVTASLDWSGVTSCNIDFNIFDAIFREYKKAGGLPLDNIEDAFYGVVGNWLNWLMYNLCRSLGDNISHEEERKLGIEQVTKVLRTLSYLADHIESLSIRIKTITERNL
jgi:Ser/Thr protein kinase RdoA (MazF antagonist)